jgi:hypothetical protein
MTNKLFILIFGITFIPNVLFAQENQLHNWIDIHTTLSKEALDLLSRGFQNDLVIDDNKSKWLIGFGYTRTLTNRFDLLTGIDYSRYSFHFSMVFSKYYSYEYFSLVSIPFNLRFKLKNRFAVTGGFLYDQFIPYKKPIDYDNQTGIGLNLKLEKDFRIAQKMLLNIGTEYTVHAIIPFYPSRFQERLSVISLCIGYKFGY